MFGFTLFGKFWSTYDFINDCVVIHDHCLSNFHLTIIIIISASISFNDRKSNFVFNRCFKHYSHHGILFVLAISKREGFLDGTSWWAYQIMIWFPVQETREDARKSRLIAVSKLTRILSLDGCIQGRDSPNFPGFACFALLEIVGWFLRLLY